MKFLLIFCIVILGKSTFAIDHAIVASKAFRIGVKETVVLNLHGYTLATVNAYLRDLPDRAGVFSQINPMVLNATACERPVLLEFLVTSNDIVRIRRRQYVEMTIRVTSSQSDFEEVLEVYVSKESGYLFIVTDRPIYRPDERVTITVFSLNQGMEPEKNLWVNVTVKTPDGIGVSRKSVQFVQSVNKPRFIEVPFKIAENSIFGKWTVEARFTDGIYETKTEIQFVVQRYVLPTFQVEVKPDKNFILVSDNAISGAITAQYSYGESVNGHSFLSLRLKRSGDQNEAGIEFYRRPANYTEQVPISRGRQTFSIPIGNLENALDGETLQALADAHAVVSIEATVNGDAEGVLEAAVSNDLPILNSPYFIDTSRISKYFTPGIAYQMLFSIRDALNLQTATRVSFQVKSGNQILFNGITSTSGGANVQLDFIGNAVQHLTIITADTDLDDVDQAFVDLDIQPYSSASEKYLQIYTQHTLLDTEDIQDFFVIFRYSDAFRDLNPVPQIRYFVLSRGSIVTSGSNQPNTDSQESTQRITLTQKMVPSARIVAYYLINSEVVSNSLWIDVANRCKDTFTVTVRNENGEVMPSGAIEFEVSGPNDALVSISGVDRAAYFLYNGSRLLRKSMFDNMENYDQGCVRNGGSDGSNVFTGAGLTLTTSSIRPVQVVTLNCTNSNVGKKRRKRQIYVNSMRDEKLKACRENGELESNLEESCEDRRDRCVDNFERNYPGCCERFYQNCKVTTRQRYVANIFGLVGRSGVLSRVSNAVAIAKPRNDFKENFMKTIKLDANGHHFFQHKASSSITTYDITSVSMQDAEDGFCIAPPTKVRVFKKVFVQLYLPYALKKGEQADIRLSVFNYDKQQRRTVIVYVWLSEELCSSHLSGEWSRLTELTVYSESTQPSSFAVLPLKVSLGADIKIRVRDESNDQILDTIEKTIEIEDVGEIEETHQSIAIDLKDNRLQATNIVLDFPENFVAGTRKCTILAHANFMGAAIEINNVTKEPNDISNSLRSPGGCGEQNMKKSGPIVYVHMYLVAVGKLVVGTIAHAQSVNKINEGYNIQLGHRSTATNLAAFSVYSSSPPSTWLTAYVVKVFAKAKELVIDLSIEQICTSVEWLLDQQMADGSFDEDRTNYYYQLQGTTRGAMTLVPYVIIALIEAKPRCPQHADRIVEVVQNAVNYLEVNKNHADLSETHALALMSYALALHDPTSLFATEINDELIDLRLYSNGGREIYWDTVIEDQSNSWWKKYIQDPFAVEVAAYALLAQIERSKCTPNNQGEVDQNTLDLTRKIVIWLINQRNAGGAFISTQDTVIGLQALATYQMWINCQRPIVVSTDFDISLVSPFGTAWSEPGHTISLDATNEQLGVKLEIPPNVVNGRSIAVRARGTGEGVLSYRCIYRSVVENEPCSFILTQHVSNVQTQSGPSKIKLTLTVSSLNGTAAGMSAVIVRLLSGYVPDEQSVANLDIGNVVDGIVDRYEITNQSVVFYLRQITNESTRIAFVMTQNIVVPKPQPAKITAYSFYRPTIRCGIFYALPEGSRRLRTSNCSGENAEFCKCAERGCSTCRTREQQLSNTQCLGRSDQACPICDGESCDNLYDIACRSNTNYVYIVRVTEVVEGGNIFTYFRVEIVRILKHGNDVFVEGSSNHTQFTSRTDCFDSCKDPALLNKDGTFRPYVKVGSELLVMGGAPEAAMDRNGNSVSHYRLDVHAFVERHIPATVCDRSRTAYRGERLRCFDSNHDRSNKQDARCVRLGKLISACNTFEEFVTQLAKGCD